MDGLPLPVVAGVFVAAAAVIAFAGSKLSLLADRLADATGMGEAIAGALFLGGTTSLPGIITSVTAAAEGAADLAVSNAIGGIAAQTVFLVVADAMYGRANLEHAAASLANMLQGALLLTLLALPVLATTLPELVVWQVHLVSPLMFVLYAFGLHIASHARQRPMWRPERTPETRRDEPDAANVREALGPLWGKFAVFGLTTAVAGWVVAQAGLVIAAETWLSETAVGGLFTAVATSLPELVTSVAAVRAGAETLAVAGVIGGNAFDTLFLATADVFYRDGSIYTAIVDRPMFLLGITIVMTGVLLMGLMHRQKHGILNIGWEGVVILALYAGAAYRLFA